MSFRERDYMGVLFHMFKPKKNIKCCKDRAEHVRPR